jgi:hypothetical protein
MNFKNACLLRLFFALGLISTYSSVVVAQIAPNNLKDKIPQENSPLSRLGLGNLMPRSFAASAGMGGLTAAWRDPYHFSSANPASISSLRLTAFELGLYAKNNNVSGKNDQSSTSWSGNLSYLGLAFPTYSTINEALDRKERQVRWGMGLSIAPYTTVGYNTSFNIANLGTDSSGLIQYFLANGSTYKALLGNGVEYKGFSVGVNMGYLFGKNNYIRQTAFGSSLGVPVNNFFDQTFQISGFTWNAGLQYDWLMNPKDIKGDRRKEKRLIFGVYGNPATAISVKTDTLYTSVPSSPPVDTLYVSGEKSGKGKLPAEVTFGVMFHNASKMKIGAEYHFTNWSAYQNDLRPEKLANASEFALGAEFLFNKDKIKTAEEKWRYRLGFRSGSDPRLYQNTAVQYWTATAGLGVPVRVGRGGQISYMNLALEYGDLTVKNVSEKYYRITFGLTMNDNSWFLKRKFQ